MPAASAMREVVIWSKGIWARRTEVESRMVWTVSLERAWRGVRRVEGAVMGASTPVCQKRE